MAGQSSSGEGEVERGGGWTGARLRWLSNPPVTGARDLTVINVTLAPGKGHNFITTPIRKR
jgi:hypothetical protein